MSLNTKKTVKPVTKLVIRTAGFINIVVNGAIIHMLNEIQTKECQCISDWRHNYCKYYSSFMLLLNTVILITGTVDILNGIAPLIKIASLINVFALATYLHRLKQDNCNCEYSGLQTSIRYIYYVLTGLYIVSFAVIVFLMGNLITTKL
jgi:hypothetical protein